MPFTGRNSPMKNRSVASARGFDRLEFGLRHAIMNDAHEAVRLADLLAENLAAIGALEQEQRPAHQQDALEREIHAARPIAVTEQQAAAMWRIGAHHARPGIASRA